VVSAAILWYVVGKTTSYGGEIVVADEKDGGQIVHAETMVL
jgi:hypothetical protein